MHGNAIISLETGLSQNNVNLLNDVLRVLSLYLAMLLYKRMYGTNSLSSPQAFMWSLVIALVLYDVVMVHVLQFQ